MVVQQKLWPHFVYNVTFGGQVQLGRVSLNEAFATFCNKVDDCNAKRRRDRALSETIVKTIDAVGETNVRVRGTRKPGRLGAVASRRSARRWRGMRGAKRPRVLLCAVC